MYIKFEESSKYNITLEMSVFTQNQPPEMIKRTRAGSGGGIEAGYYFLENIAPRDNSISINHCHFINNYANFGGGTSLFSSYALRTNLNNKFHQIGCI